MEYLYLFEVDDNIPTYKIGKTKRHYNDRLREYTNIRKTIDVHPVQDADISEKILMNELSKLNGVTRRRDLGLEYYSGTIDSIHRVFSEITDSYYQNNLVIPMKFDIVCDDCQRSFATIGGLKNHKRHCKANLMAIDT